MSGHPHRFDHDEGTPTAGTPHLLTQASHRPFFAARPRESLDEVDGVVPGQWSERQGGHVGLALQLVERSPEHRGVEQILHSHRHHQKKPARLEAAGGEGQQPDAHLVSPVEVFENQDRRLPLRHVSEEQGHPLEELPVIGGRRQLTVFWREFGKETSQLATDGPRQSLSPPPVLRPPPGPQRVHPGAEWQDLLALVTAPDQYPSTHLVDPGRQFGHQSGLADARFTDDGHHPTPTTDRLGERRSQPCHLLVSPDEGGICGQHEGPAWQRCEGWRDP